MASYILKRILSLIPTFFGATFLAFLIIQMAPGDYLTQLELDPKVTPETIARLRAQFGLDRPFHEQYLLWMHNLLHLNLGYSFAYQAPVLEIVWPRVLNSMVLVVPSTVLLFLIAVPVGVYGAWGTGWSPSSPIWASPSPTSSWPSSSCTWCSRSTSARGLWSSRFRG